MTEYVLGTSDHELARLTLQQEVWGEVTGDFLDALALRPGARVLDAGCGPGLLIEPFRRRIGPSGSVLAVDESARWIEHVEGLRAQRGWENVRTRRGRVEELSLEPGSLDLVFLRWVLGFLPDPARVLVRLAAALAPDGLLAVIDYNHEGVSLFPPSEGFDAIVRATRRLYASRGGDPWVMGRIPRLYHEAGLETAVLLPRVLCGGPSSGAFRWADAFFPFHAAGMVEAGVLTAAERELFLREWSEHRGDPDALFFSPILVCAAGRKREGSPT